MAETRAHLNRKIRQDALRDQLENQGHLQHVNDIVNKISDPDQDIDIEMLSRYKITIDSKLKLINKYLPDLKSTEITGDADRPLVVSSPVTFIDAGTD